MSDNSSKPEDEFLSENKSEISEYESLKTDNSYNETSESEEKNT